MSAYASPEGYGFTGGQPKSDWRATVGKVFGSVAHFVDSVFRAARASARFQQLNSMPDHALLARGLSRGELTRAAFEESFGKLGNHENSEELYLKN